MTTASTLAVLWRHGRRLTLQDEQELKGHLFLRAEARLRRLHEHGRACVRACVRACRATIARTREMVLDC